MNIQIAHEKLLGNLRLLQKIHTAQALADAIGISRSSWTSRMKEPWKQFGWDDFYLIAKYCRVDFTTLINGEIKLQ